ATVEKLTEKTIHTNKISDANIIPPQVDDVALPNGRPSQREIVKHPGAVATIPVTPDGKIIFVKQYRKPMDKTLLEIPAGKIETNEAKEITAIRELEEETGFTTKQLDYVTSFYTSPGFADELMHLYYTDSLQELDEK